MHFFDLPPPEVATQGPDTDPEILPDTKGPKKKRKKGKSKRCPPSCFPHLGVPPKFSCLP